MKLLEAEYAFDGSQSRFRFRDAESISATRQGRGWCTQDESPTAPDRRSRRSEAHRRLRNVRQAVVLRDVLSAFDPSR